MPSRSPARTRARRQLGRCVLDAWGYHSAPSLGVPLRGLSGAVSVTAKRRNSPCATNRSIRCCTLLCRGPGKQILGVASGGAVVIRTFAHRHHRSHKIMAHGVANRGARICAPHTAAFWVCGRSAAKCGTSESQYGLALSCTVGLPQAVLPPAASRCEQARTTRLSLQAPMALLVTSAPALGGCLAVRATA
jgi:hypothetical protein